MRCWTVVAATAVVFTTGCTHSQLQRSTVHQSRTVADLQYDQVLANLAMTDADPGILPSFSVVGSGGTGVTDLGGANAELEWDPQTLARRILGVNASRQIEEQWTLAPVVNPDKLRALKCAYQIIVYGKATDPEADGLLKAFLGDGYAEWLQPGWLRVGGKHDVPKDARYVGRCRDHAVWVTPDGLEGLTRLTIVTLNIATLDAGESPPEPTKSVQKFKYNADGRVESIETITRPDIDGKSGLPKSPTLPPRGNFYNPLQSQIQMRGR